MINRRVQPHIGLHKNSTQGYIDAAAAVVGFLSNLEKEFPQATFGCREVGEAIEGLAFLLGVKPDQLRLLAKNAPPPPKII